MADANDAPDTIPVSEIDQHPAQVAAAEPADAPDSIPVSEIDQHPATAAPDSIPVSEIDQHPAEGNEQPKTSAIGAGLRAAGREAAPVTGGVAAGLAGAGVGAAAGAAIGGVGALPGAIVGGLVGGFAGGAAVSKAQQAIIDMLGLGDISSGYNPFSTAYEQADVAQHPLATKVGGIAPVALGMAVDPAAGIGQRAISAGLMGASDVGQQLVTKGTVDDPASVALSVAAGATFPTPRAGLANLETVGGRVASRLLSGGEPLAKPQPVKPQETPGAAGRPDITADATADQTGQTPKQEIVEAQDLTPVSQGTAQENAPVKVGFETVGQPEGQGAMLAPKSSGPEDYGKKPVYVSGNDVGVTTGQNPPEITLALNSANDNAPAPTPQTAEQAVNSAAIMPDHQLDQRIAASHPNQGPPLGPKDVTPPLPHSIDPVEASRLMQPALDNAKANNAGTGEDVTAPVTPEQAEPRPPITLESAGRGQYNIRDNNGKLLASADIGIVNINGKRLAQIDDINTPALDNVKTQAEHNAAVAASRNSLGPSQIREAMRQFLALHPDVEGFNGNRVSGARNGGAMGPGNIKNVTVAISKSQAPVTAEEGVRVLPPGAKRAIQQSKTPKVVRDAITLMQNSDHPDMKAGLEHFNSLPAWQQEVLATQGAAARVQNRPTIEGAEPVQVRDKGDLARKQRAVDAIKSVYPDLQAIQPGDPQATQKIADAYRKAVVANNNADPLTTYKPRKKSPEYQLLAAAKPAALMQPGSIKLSTAKLQKFHDLNTMLRAGGAKDAQDTARINADIELNPRTGINTEAINTPEPDAPRVDFEPALPDRDARGNILPNQDRMKAQNDFQNWLEGLNDRDYADATHGFDVRQEVRSGSDPAELKKQMVSQLADAYLRRQRGQPRPPVMEPVPAEDAAGTPKPITSRADIPEPGPVANEWKSIDATTPEGQAIAKAALDAINAKVGKPSTDERLAAAKGTLRDPANVGSKIMSKFDAAAKTYRNILGDTSASLRPPALEWMQKGADWFNSLWSPDRDPFTGHYSKDLGGDFNVRANASMNTDLWIRQQAQKAPDLTDNEWRDMDRAYQKKQLDTLPQKLQDVHRDIIKPIIEKYNAAYDHVRTLDPSLNLPMRKLTPSDFAPRTAMGKTEIDDPDVNDPIVGKRGLTNWASALQDRDFFTLVDKTTGARGSLLRANKFDGQAGDTVKYKGKDWTVDHAWPEEITAATDVHYHENPLYNWLNAYRGVQNIRDNLLMLQKVQNDKRFLSASTTNADLAKKLGYIPTKMEQFKQRDGKDLFMDKRIAYVMDDFAQAGFDDMTLHGMRQLSTGLAKVLYTFGPVIHAFNEADLWAVGRGFDWLTPGGMRSLGVNGVKAIKSVTTQDDLQRQIRALGGNPMLAGTLTRGVMGQVAKKAGLEIAQNPPKWDPLARTFGISSSKLSNAMYQQSTKGMWWLSDVLLTQRVLENMDLHKMTMPDAIKEAHEFISDYRVGGTVAGSRNLSKLYQDPALSLFGRYHLGIFNSYGNIANRVLKGSGPERTRAIGQLMVAGAMAYAMYPLLDKGAQMLTGNKYASVGRRGFSAIPAALSNIAQGKKDITAVTPDLFTPSMPINAAIEAIKNRDYTGKQIVQQGDLRSTKAAGRALVQEGEYAAKNLVSPYSTLSSAVEQPRASAGSVAKKFGTQALGIKDPGQREIAYNNKIVKENQTAAKARFKKPQSMAESVYNRIFGR